MRRKRLNHYADVVCKMFVGWRMGGDLEVMSDLPNGTITLNLLTGDAKHSLTGELSLHIGKEIQAWLQQQAEKDGVDVTQLEKATLEVEIDTSKVATNKKKVVMFHFDCCSSLETDETSYEGNLKDIHFWHTRIRT